MKRFFKILGIVLLLLCIVCGVVAYQNRSNIAGLITAMKYSGDEIQTKLDDSNADLKGEISKYLDGDLRDFTEEEKQAIENGETTREEVLAEIITEDAANKTPSNPAPGSKTPETKKPTSCRLFCCREGFRAGNINRLRQGFSHLYVTGHYLKSFRKA